MALESLQDLYLEQLRDLHSAERQIIEALPKMIEQTSHPELRQAFELHLRQTEEQLRRLEQIGIARHAPPSHEIASPNSVLNALAENRGVLFRAAAALGQVASIIRQFTGLVDHWVDSLYCDTSRASIHLNRLLVAKPEYPR